MHLEEFENNVIEVRPLQNGIVQVIFIDGNSISYTEKQWKEKMQGMMKEKQVRENEANIDDWFDKL